MFAHESRQICHPTLPTDRVVSRKCTLLLSFRGCPGKKEEMRGGAKQTRGRAGRESGEGGKGVREGSEGGLRRLRGGPGRKSKDTLAPFLRSRYREWLWKIKGESHLLQVYNVTPRSTPGSIIGRVGAISAHYCTHTQEPAAEAFSNISSCGVRPASNARGRGDLEIGGGYVLWGLGCFR